MPDTSTEVAIATTTLGSAASTITFSSIPGTYTDLRLVLVCKTSSQFNNPGLRFNSDSGTNYSATLLDGNGSTAASTRQTAFDYMSMIQTGITSDTLEQLYTADIFSYAGSTNKTALLSASADRNGGGRVANSVGLWRSTSAITSIVIISAGGADYSAGTTATLYGIL